MATESRRPVDPADVKAVLELEAKVIELLFAIEQVRPAAERLADAGYAGADDVLDQLGGYVRWRRVPNDGDPRLTVRALGLMRLGAGDQAAVDYHELVIEAEMDVDEAAAELLEREGSESSRAGALRRYAAAR